MLQFTSVTYMLFPSEQNSLWIQIHAVVSTAWVKMFQKLDLKCNRNKVMIHLLVFTAYFTEHCNSLTSPSNTQICSDAADTVPLWAFVILFKFLWGVQLQREDPDKPAYQGQRCLHPYVQSGKLKTLFQPFLSPTFRVAAAVSVGVNDFVPKKTQQVTDC